jgi:hypothetical protein
MNQLINLIVFCFQEHPVQFTLLTLCLVFGPAVQRAGARRKEERAAKTAVVKPPVPKPPVSLAGNPDWRDYKSQVKPMQPPSPRTPGGR